MDIEFASTKLAKQMNDDKSLAKAFGSKQARRIRTRLDDLEAAADLEEMRGLAGHCHELTGDRDGQLAIDLIHPYRLIFEPSEDPAPEKDDGGLDWSDVKGVRILEVIDYH